MSENAIPTRSTARRRLYWTLAALFVVLGVILVFYLLSGMLLLQRESARRERCDVNLARLYMGLAEYADANGSFPPAFVADAEGRKLHSWRVLVLPFIGEAELFSKIRLDESWDSEYNAQFHAQSLPIFQCASSPNEFQKPGFCAVSAVLGERTAFPEDGRAVALTQLADGAANTILLVERKRPICWMNPDAELTETQVLADNAKPTKEREDFGSWHGPGEYVLFCDGHRAFVSEKVDEKILKLLLNIDDSAETDAASENEAR
ncbi:MAG: DUF1559 domain-containing protein [Thermoguttaceae bacterium]|nr:DUF1559 domain-containing protein [Thermoguttaceae bacterium]